jgi:hypothetical protein
MGKMEKNEPEIRILRASIRAAACARKTNGNASRLAATSLAGSATDGVMVPSPMEPPHTVPILVFYSVMPAPERTTP